jgi:hypothetical protein
MQLVISLPNRSHLRLVFLDKFAISQQIVDGTAGAKAVIDVRLKCTFCSCILGQCNPFRCARAVLEKKLGHLKLEAFLSRFVDHQSLDAPLKKQYALKGSLSCNPRKICFSVICCDDAFVCTGMSRLWAWCLLLLTPFRLTALASTKPPHQPFILQLCIHAVTSH